LVTGPCRSRYHGHPPGSQWSAVASQTSHQSTSHCTHLPRAIEILPVTPAKEFSSAPLRIPSCGPRTRSQKKYLDKTKPLYTRSPVPHSANLIVRLHATPVHHRPTFTRFCFAYRLPYHTSTIGRLRRENLYRAAVQSVLGQDLGDIGLPPALPIHRLKWEPLRISCLSPCACTHPPRRRSRSPPSPVPLSPVTYQQATTRSRIPAYQIYTYISTRPPQLSSKMPHQRRKSGHISANTSATDLRKSVTVSDMSKPKRPAISRRQHLPAPRSWDAATASARGNGKSRWRMSVRASRSTGKSHHPPPMDWNHHR
jgi:hypothetical protein